MATLVIVGVAAALIIPKGHSGFLGGGGSATIHWQSIDNGTGNYIQPYAGTIAGIPVNGTASVSAPAGGTSTLTLARWSGTYRGRAFILTVSADPSQLRGVDSGVHGTYVVDISGTYGTLPVHGTARTSTNSSNAPITFNATIGPHHAVGTVRVPRQRGSSGSATATFTVTS